MNLGQAINPRGLASQQKRRSNLHFPCASDECLSVNGWGKSLSSHSLCINRVRTLCAKNAVHIYSEACVTC